VLLGDAAFVARPHVGAGVTKAALDAMGLADAIRAAGDNIDVALERYNCDQRRLELSIRDYIEVAEDLERLEPG